MEMTIRKISMEVIQNGIVVFVYVFYLNVLGAVTKVDADLHWYELNNTCYGIASPATALNFTEAKSSCIKNKALLVRVPRLDVHTFLTYRMDPGTNYWVDLLFIPLTNEFVWPDGNTPMSSMWYPNEPNFSGDRVRYTRTTGGTPQIPYHLLADNVDVKLYSYICQKNAAGEIGTGEEITSAEASHYVTMDSITTNSRLRCAEICLRTVGCVLIGFLNSKSECLLLRWSVDNVLLIVDPEFRFHTIQRACDIQ